MKKEQHEARCPEQYLTAIGLDPERVIYFDIETTGFRASTSQLYMIGWAVKEKNTWVVTQLLAETAPEEPLLLQLFLEVLQKYDTIIEFNGDRFDLPYMREKYSSFGMADPFEGLRTVDLYQEIRPLKSLLGMPRLNQKSVEQFLHITREDPYNGGELIEVYRSVRGKRSSDMAASVRSLFLHNYEDVLGMLAMTPVISYPMLTCSCAPVNGRITQEDPGTGRCIEASFLLEVPVPENICTDMGSCQIKVCGQEVTVRIPLVHRTLYHFFPDYKDYFYLPEEDTAMHKSVACFVDPAHRKKATAQNCYIKKDGIFLPQTDERFLPSFRTSYKDRLFWFEFRPQLLDDREAFSAYIHSLIGGL